MSKQPAKTETPPKAPEKKWYILCTYPGFEERVEFNLRKRMENKESAKEKIFQIKIPQEKFVEMKNGKKREMERKFLPGYVFIEMIMDNDSWDFVRSTPGISNFIGANNKPEVISEVDLQQILQQANDTKLKATPTTSRVAVGDQVRIVDGPFKNFNGVIEEVWPDKEKLKVSVEIFGRATPIEVDYLQVEQL